MSSKQKKSLVASGAAVSVLALALIVVMGALSPSDTSAPFSASIAALELPEIRGEEKAVITKAPNVPPPITRNHATRVIVELETIEVTKELAPGVDYRFWTFGGDVPGDFIRVREGDVVEMRLKNHHSSIVPHNIDLHAVTGPGGGANASWTGPGQETVFEFSALKPGLYVYHCAVPSVGEHVANGMYGLIFVEPKEGLPEVDREFYVMQGEFYTEGAHGERGLQPFSYEKALDERPDYVVFNGAVGSLTGENALKANVGETVRLFLGNGGPNLVSSFHVIGAVLDNVYSEGGTTVNHNVQTTLLPAGGSAIAEFRLDVPGRFLLVDHSIFRTDKGAAGFLDVEGPENLTVFNPHGSVEIEGH